MADRVCTRFRDDDGLDIGCHLVTKEYMLENYPDLVPWMKAPGLWVWGSNSAGSLGTNDVVFSSSPVQTISSGTNWKQVSIGLVHSAAIKTDGTLWLWGYGNSGILGNNSIVDQSSPVQTISGGTNWKRVSLGGLVGNINHSAAIKTDGTLWLWGHGTGGKLGNNTTLSQSSPVQTVSAGTDWKEVSIGGQHSSAIKTDGTLWLWGCATGGSLGDNTIIHKSSPVQTISGGTNWKQVSLGLCHSGAIKTDGTLWLWGSGICGVLGNASLINQSSPVQTISGGTNWKQVSLGGRNTAAIKTDGTLWVWGHGFGGRLGTGSTISQSSPVQTVSGGTNWRQVSVACAHSAAIKTDGTLWLWGYGSAGRLGNESAANRSSPVQTISGGNSWKQVSLGSLHSAAICDEGEY